MGIRRGSIPQLIRQKPALSLGSAFAVLILLFSGLAVILLSSALERQFVASVQWLTHAFVDEVELLSGQIRDEAALRSKLQNWAQETVEEYLLFAQIVQGDTVLAEHKSPAALNLRLSAERLDTAFVVRKAQLPSGMPYLDMLRTLPNEQGYLRVGIALDRVSAAVNLGALIIALGGVITLFVAIALVVYLTRPVPAVVVASQQGVATPAANGKVSLVQAGQLFIDDSSKEIRVNGDALKLSPREYSLLKLLASEPGRVFSDDEILKGIWPQDSYATSGDVRNYIRLLRRKLEADPSNPQVILTVKGFGYKLAA